MCAHVPKKASMSPRQGQEGAGGGAEEIGAANPSIATGSQHILETLCLSISNGFRAAAAEGWLGLPRRLFTKQLSLLEGGSDRSRWK